ncbi:2-hydroxychromene-2-carboxylate isomerase [Parapusillimonas granuli]|uniref:2-hydroxychromene-2-carboxylate isomerase n=1 Tax=Parapusillimonas granuli TaxID=380911 RepID=A0A853FUI0_9BURK|nr:2-hydroxychromene-2-carboxylate isomerase [Parapusillimonas granuli]MBB5213550.1 2-hydroxychromene-2-carboxylate isomerase [Parapusillimonas granuli]NYT48388.1 2-hydroxychromene-2-carboxylate isomerase [Parapusillimonas granuli]
MTDTLDFYFDFSSPYGYFASTAIEQLAADIRRTVRWRPILLGPMFKAMGSGPLVEIPLKGAYARHDIARSARLFGIPYREPAVFPIAAVAASRAALLLQEDDPQQAAEFIKRVYRAYFAEGRDITDMDVLVAAADQAGADGSRLPAGVATDRIKSRLKEEVDAAMARGVFGSPYMIVDGEPFWGFDRFEHIRKWAASAS